MSDPWTERNLTKAGRAAAQKELDLKKQKAEFTKRKLISSGPKADIGYPKPKPFWEPH